MKCLLVLSALLTLTPALWAQVLPWRRQMEQRLGQQDRLISQLLQMQRQPAPAPPGPIIVMPEQPQQQLPVPGEPKQQLPIPGEPKQRLPIPGEPKQPLPPQGKPKQPLPPQGQPRQELAVMPRAESQRYSIVVRALYYGGRRR